VGRRTPIVWLVAKLGVAAACLGLLGAPPAPAIVGGSPSSTATYPFMVSVQRDGSHLCGGSVVAPSFVLTAAHCVPDGKATGLTVVIGRTTLSQPTGLRHGVLRVLVHPRYESGEGHDAALLQLRQPTKATPIAMATTVHDRDERPGTVLRVTGWGDTTPLVGGGLLPSDRLRQVDVPVVADTDCGASATELCAGEAFEDSCQGDSGGPLFTTSGAPRVQVGIVSSGLGCGIPGFPGYYTEVNARSVRDWARYITRR
jgi:trypsin